MSFKVRYTIPARSDLKPLAGVTNSENTLTGGGSGGNTGPTGPSGGGGSSVIKRSTESIPYRSIFSDYTGTISFTGSFTSIPTVVASSSIGSLHVTDTTVDNFSYTLQTSSTDSDFTKIDLAKLSSYSTLKYVNGNPSIAFIGASSVFGNVGFLSFVRANNSVGTSWPSIFDGSRTIVDTGNKIQRVGLTLLSSGYPAISYYTATELYYVSSADINGDVWNTPILVESGIVAEDFSSITLVGGKPAIAYYTSSPSTIKYAISGIENPLSPSDWTVMDVHVVDSISTNYNSPILEVVNGNPAIIYSGTNIYFTRSIVSSPTQSLDWGTPVIVAPVPANISFAMFDNTLYIAYYVINEIVASSIKIVLSNTDGLSWSDPEDVVSVNNVSIPILLNINASPYILYTNPDVGTTDYRLRYVFAPSIGETWSPEITLSLSYKPEIYIQAISNGLYPDALFKNTYDNEVYYMSALSENLKLYYIAAQ